MLGLKCKVTNTDIVKAGYTQGVLTVPAADNVVRLLPALNISDDDIRMAVTLLDKAAKSLSSE
jgi:acetylornithine/N-succinyldiaminopimelate aminotransferase